MEDGRRSDASEVRRRKRFMALNSGRQRRLHLSTMTTLPATNTRRIFTDDVKNAQLQFSHPSCLFLPFYIERITT